MGRTAKTHYKGLDSENSVKGRGRTLCGLFVARKQLVIDGATCATCERREVEAFLGPLPKKKPPPPAGVSTHRAAQPGTSPEGPQRRKRAAPGCDGGG